MCTGSSSEEQLTLKHKSRSNHKTVVAKEEMSSDQEGSVASSSSVYQRGSSRRHPRQLYSCQLGRVVDSLIHR